MLLRKKRVQWDYELVKSFVESESSCQLISKEYVNRNEKIILECHCQETFSVSFGSFKDGNKRQCNKCSRKNTDESRRFTIEYVRNYIDNESLSGCKLISNAYVNSKTTLVIKCKCGELFETGFNQFKDREKRQCNGCGRKIANKNIMLSQQEFYERVEGLFEGKYLVIGEYKGSKKKVEMRCVKHKVNYFQRAGSILRSRIGCEQCQNEIYASNGCGRRKTHEEFLDSFYKIQSPNEYEIVSEYTSLKENVDVRHLACNRIWNTSPSSLLGTGGCPYCSTKAMKTTDAFVEEVYQLVGNEFQVLGEYKGGRNKIKMKHIKCSHEYEVTPANFLQGQRCPQCNESKGERLVRKAIESLHIKFTPEHRVYHSENKRKFLVYDFYIENKILIEFDGTFHFVARDHFGGQKKLQYQIERDILKNNYAIENSFVLIRIPFWEKDSVDIIVSDLVPKILNGDSIEVSEYANYVVSENWNHSQYLLSSYNHIKDYERKGFINNLNLKESV